ncbi:uncharacterized protein [Ptychodera flava]|uniref:uncharacterized protein n=1 Tax=Ptychodera flava TaxID=63121 RepID=UPI003969DC77
MLGQSCVNLLALLVVHMAITTLSEGKPAKPSGNQDGSDIDNAEAIVILDQIKAETEYFSMFDSDDVDNPQYPNYGGRPGQSTDETACQTVTGVPSYVRTSMGLSTFYQKYTHAYNIPVLSSSRVPDAALRRACYILRFMMADRRDLRQQMYDKYGRIGIMAQSEVTLHIPEHSRLPASYNQRARGLGGTLHIPISTGAEENVLCYPRDPYRAEDILLHEFAHGIHKIAAVSADRTFEPRLRQAYNSARARGLWAGTYAMNTIDEYFAEGTQSYFDQNPSTPSPGIHNTINTRSELRYYDPTLYGLVEEIFPCGNRVIDRCADQSNIHTQNIRMNCDGSEPVTPEPPTPPLPPTPEPPTPPLPPTKQPEETETPQTPPLPTTKAPVTMEPPPPPPSTQEPENGCVDENTRCAEWANRGECDINPDYMLVNCKKSCRVGDCDDGTGGEECIDNNTDCARWSRYGECQRNPGYMLQNCKKSCNQCGECTDSDQRCSGWAARGECRINPGYMTVHCKRSCQQCR